MGSRFGLCSLGWSVDCGTERLSACPENPCLLGMICMSVLVNVGMPVRYSVMDGRTRVGVRIVVVVVVIVVMWL